MTGGSSNPRDTASYLYRDTCPQKGETALIHAVRCGNFNAIDALIDAGADVDLQSHVMCTVPTKQADACCKLRPNRANHSPRRQSGATAMIVAVTLDHSRCLQRLIESGAQLDLENGKGDTAFMLATRAHNKKCMALLKLAKKVK